MNEIPGKVLKSALETGPAAEIERAVRSGEDIKVYASAPLLPLLVAVIFLRTGGPLLVAVEREARRLAEDVDFFLPGESFHLPGGALGGDWFRPYDEDAGQRFRAARALGSGKVVVADAEAVTGGMPGDLPEPWPLRLGVGSEIEMDRLLGLLSEGGYQREYAVEGWGRFAVRGGILDVFPSTAERPVRMEFVGDRVESLREFNVVTQRSGESLAILELYPAGDAGLAVREGGLDRGLVIAVDPDLIEARAESIAAEAVDARPGVLDGLGRRLDVLTLGNPGDGGVTFPGEPVRMYRGDLTAAVGDWKRYLSSGEDVLLALENAGQVERARELWEENGGGPRAPAMGVGRLSRGFRLPEARLAVFTTADLLGRRERRRASRKSSSGAPVTGYAELEVGGYVVHIDQGIGIYRGLASREVLGVTREYLLLEYAEGDRLYVPTSQLNKIQRYVGSENPTVHRLRGREWTRARRRARRSAERTARELLALYLERKTRRGFSFSPDTPWQRELEESFEYEDTPDQARATADVKADMESDTAMDRLICGDVGYGKTEVAVRAAMKAVMDSKQVCVLVPTTVLASQHLDTFRQRLAGFPVRVAMLSRFLSGGEQKEVLAALAVGEVDIVIGTHRLLQGDVVFRDLGLLVVDEEQKFGVEHKERLKRMSRGVDTLTLTATPIPRTLQMSLSGVRDISIIDTPPEDRHPVATYVGEFDMGLVRRALRYEAARGGQAFYVHNRVQSIDFAAESLRREVPDVSVAVAHGRMDEEELELVMLDFAEGRYDVLVCTTIIESGLDLPNVNTLIVERADLLGLAQLYQIKGRVGRALRKAYAYLFYPNRSALTESATARLATIAAMTALGSGMKVALRDLEIRGAGNLLGAEQSGNIEAVGFEFYCQLLRESVDILKGATSVEVRRAVVELPVDAYIPSDYISDQESRVEIYRRLVGAVHLSDIDDIGLELEDRFGERPEPVELMLEVERIRLAAAEAGVESVSVRGDELLLQHFPGQEGVFLALAGGNTGAIGGDRGMYYGPGARTLYCELRFNDVKNRQILLLKWLNSIIDDIICLRRDDSESDSRAG